MWVFGGTLIPSSSDLTGVRAIAAADPQFVLNDFVEYARTVHTNVHAATATGDYSRVVGATHPDLQHWLQTEATGRQWRDQVDAHVHTAVIAAGHPGPDSATDTDTITVRFGAKLGGRDIVEDWGFARPAGDYPHLRGVTPAGCSSCGAPLAIDPQGNCRYCATHLLGVAGAWRATTVSAPRRLDRPTTSATLDDLDPDFPVDDFLSFARTAYQNVHRATASGGVGSVGDILTAEMREHLESPPDDLFWDLTITEVQQIDIVDAQHGRLDLITARFRSKAPDVDPDADIVEDWVFERPAPARSLGDRIADGAAPPPTRRSECAFCGAAIDLDEDGNCRFCGTHLLGVAGDWRLARAHHPQGEMVSNPLFVHAMQRRGCQIGLLLFVVGTFLAAVALIVALAAAGRP